MTGIHYTVMARIKEHVPIFGHKRTPTYKHMGVYVNLNNALCAASKSTSHAIAWTELLAERIPTAQPVFYPSQRDYIIIEIACMPSSREDCQFTRAMSMMCVLLPFNYVYITPLLHAGIERCVKYQLYMNKSTILVSQVCRQFKKIGVDQWRDDLTLCLSIPVAVVWSCWSWS